MYKATFTDNTEATNIEYFDTMEEAQEWVRRQFAGTQYTQDGNTYSGEWENFDGETFEMTAEIVEA